MKEIILVFVLSVFTVALLSCTLPQRGANNSVIKEQHTISPYKYDVFYSSRPPFNPGYKIRRWAYKRYDEYVRILFIDRKGHRHSEVWTVDGLWMRQDGMDKWHKKNKFLPRASKPL